MGSKGLISVSEAEALSTREVEALYADFISPRQVRLFKRLSPSRDQVDTAIGPWLNMKSGARVLDLTGGIGVLGHGHNHPRILHARKKFSEKRKMEVNKSFLSPYSAALAHNLAQVLPGGLQYSYFPNSGAEAVEGAVKMAFKYFGGERDSVVVSNIGFHGKTLGAGSLTQSKESSYPFPKISNVFSAKYGDIESWAEMLSRLKNRDGSSRVYAAVVEPLSSSAMQEASAEFLLKLRKLCDEYGTILIFDEVYTGWGRTGQLFNFMRVEDLSPDILVYAKTLGGGKASIAGYTATERVFKKAYDTSIGDATLHSTTYFGLSEETITAIEAVNIVIEENFAERARRIGNQFSEEINQRIGSGLGWFSEFRSFGALNGLIPDEGVVGAAVRHLGSIAGRILPDPIDYFAARLVSTAATEFLYREHKVLTYVGFNIGAPLKISFPLVTRPNEVSQAAEAVGDLFTRNQRHLAAELARIAAR